MYIGLGSIHPESGLTGSRLGRHGFYETADFHPVWHRYRYVSGAWHTSGCWRTRTFLSTDATRLRLRDTSGTRKLVDGKVGQTQ